MMQLWWHCETNGARPPKNAFSRLPTLGSHAHARNNGSREYACNRRRGVVPPASSFDFGAPG